jgi:hypothetical protein
VSDQAAYDGMKRLVKDAGVGASKFAIHPVFVKSRFETPFDEPIAGIGLVTTTFLVVDMASNFQSPGTTPSPWLIGRQIASILASTISADFFIRRLNAAAQRLADDEFQTRKYELDFERARFVVEWALESSKEGKDVPQFLIERLSLGLFESQSTDAGPATAADAVASALFGSAATAKLKLGDNEILLDRKGIGQLKK